jgi:branched-subunit amino acid transport protein AzlD
MTRINMVRVVLGGLVAGLVMNVGEAALHAGVLGKDTEVLYQTWNAPLPNPAQTIPLLVGMTFLLGIVAIWLYAAIYPRIETRAARSLSAGVVVWLLAHCWSGVYMGAGYSGIFTARLAWIPVIWGFFEALLAVFIGAFLYKDVATSPTRR